MFLLTGLTTATGTETSTSMTTTSNTIYVNSRNWADSNQDGSLEHPYHELIDGYRAASDGDTVYVFTGMYFGPIKIGKSIEIVGEDREKTEVHCTGSGDSTFVIKKGISGVKISGLKIMNSAHDGVDIYGSFNTICGNIITNNFDGIELKGESSNNIIKENIITKNEWIGLTSWGSTNHISDNTIVNNPHTGIYMWGSKSDIVCNNLIEGNWDGISAQSIESATISGNNIVDNSGSGIRFEYSSSNIIFGNEISGNAGDGIYVYQRSSTSNIIKNNNVSKNNGYGIHLDSSDNQIYHNNFIENDKRNAMIWSDDQENKWDYNKQGNYWSDFDEPDEGAYDDNNDGIIDTYYPICSSAKNNRDNYPWKNPNGEGVESKSKSITQPVLGNNLARFLDSYSQMFSMLKMLRALLGI